MSNIRLMVSQDGISFCVSMSKLLFVSWEDIDQMRKEALRTDDVGESIGPSLDVADWRGIHGSKLS